ncbi:NTP pyrophosphohydrolase [Vibrio toranzoniae]|uniref:8-oxo-dGTP diphosphatase n=1 Tax=Vibrio toranzoniae TaxID=1194427 RepID=A0A120DF96_9VIBR|nr:NUDIX domain-containing protein [Vibrio toranzoniae]KWT98952.1 NTP pyrophosphohydrolase [Vibrio toranzoniae]SBS39510.1 CTP pyrophosphohydrolase [Vibrio toranzoniae]
MKVHECVSFMLIEYDSVLLEKRSEIRETDVGVINIPGGHIEGDESQAQALFREVSEELNVSPKSYKYLCSLYHPTSELQLIHYYVVDSWSGAISAQEAESVHWYPLLSAPVSIEADKLALAEFFRVGQYL